ncbi:hypothetical protein G7Y89_g9826 [Cudoniella acicularis]|uniref:Isochorismatase-like domain-containing protein n=1 Tax=Cudoniella acicularis TaxID=354080 RepID=A0A8H4VZA5_9HELO|nr:hypothetical protein G7Y89_g9826 [Cudoniella acicularis]
MSTSTIEDATAADYQRAGFARKMGWGKRPALILIDVCKAYWTAGSPLDTSANPGSVNAPDSMRRLLAAARSAKAPVLWTKVYYERPDMADAGLMYTKGKALTVWQKGDTRGLDAYVDGLVPEPEELIVVKKVPSAFFGTTLAADLHLLNVDTLVICGVSTSGCVRASTLDAMQHGFRPMVVGSACGDRTIEIQKANLFDMNAKYADSDHMKEKLDLEKGELKESDIFTSDVAVIEPENYKEKTSIWAWLSKWGVEVRGIDPVPMEERTKTNYYNIFLMWMAIMCNLLPIVTGMAGTLGYGLSLRDSSLVIIFFNLICCIMTAFLGTLGPKTGRKLTNTPRLYAVSIIAILNLIAVVGFTIISTVIVGQTLSAVSNGKMNITVGIVLGALLGLAISFCGYKVLHIFNTYSWAVTVVSIIIAVGCGGKHLNVPVSTEPATTVSILTFGCLIAGFQLPFAGIMSDFAVYYSPDAPAKRMFWYVYTGQVLPTILLMILGAAIGSCVPNVPSWNDAYASFPPAASSKLCSALRVDSGNSSPSYSPSP